MRRVSLRTVGCKLNQAETASLADAFRAAGWEVVPFGREAEAVVVNTCTVTHRADLDCRKLLRRATRDNPGAVVAATGCYAQRDPGALAGLPGVRLVAGNAAKGDLPAVVAGLGKGPAVVIGTRGEAPFLRARSSGGRTRAFLKVQDGCDNRCSYCVVWQVRGPNRSLPEDEVAARLGELDRAGYHEVVLSGVHLGSWGTDLSPRSSLARLLDRLAAGEGPRLRLSSVEPQEFDDDLVAAVARNARVCRHFHVPLQSGSDAVLQRMNRGYTAAGYRRLVEHLAAAFPGAGIGADVIVGFPGEDDGEFAETLALVGEAPLSHLHVFSFSPRPGTPAAAMPAQVPPATREERRRALAELALHKSLEWCRRQVGATLRCLVESTRDRETGLLRGVTDSYLKVLVEGPDSLVGSIVPVTVTRAEEGRVHGRVAP